MGARDKVTAGQTPAAPVFDSYARLSWNPSTRELEKIETQHEDNDATITRHGGTVGLYLDDGLSAWKSNVRRHDFEKLLQRAQSGASQGIAVWHVDRLFRQPRDLERLIDLADHGFRVISSHGSRDLSDPDDRFILRIEVAHAARSSDDTSRRIKRRHRKYREEGRFTGGRPGFGFPRRDKTWTAGEGQSEQDRPQVPAEQVSAERRALQEAVSGLLAGLTNQSEIARTWNAAGLYTTEGQPWVNNSVRDTLLRPTIAGRIEYQGELISHLPGEPIITERARLRLKAKIDGRRRGRPISDRYLGTGLIRCGRCGKTLNGQVARHPGENLRYRYGCNGQRGGCGLTIDMARTDAELRALTIARLSDPRYARAIAIARAQVSTRLAELTAEITQIEAVQSALAERVGRREMSIADFETASNFLRAEIEPLLAERDKLGSGSIDGPTEILTGVDVARQWDDADTTIERRAMLADAIGTDHVRILPSPPGPDRRRFNPDRIVLVPSDTPYISPGP